MINSVRRIGVIVACAALVAPAGASGQFTSSLGGSFNNPGSALIGTMIANRMLGDAARKAARPAARTPAATRTSPPQQSTRPQQATSPAARLTFKPVAGNLMVTELADTLVNEPADRRQLAAAFTSYLRDFDEQARKDRKPSNDVARAAAFFVMVNYFAATGNEPTDAQADGADAVFRAGLAESEAFARLGDRDRQRLYEVLVILGTFPLAAAVQSAHTGKAAQEQMFRDFARELVTTLLGVPVEKIQLTATGFRIEE